MGEDLGDSAIEKLRSAFLRTSVEEGDWLIIKQWPSGNSLRVMAQAILLNIGSWSIRQLRDLIDRVSQGQYVGIESIFGELVTCEECREAFLNLVTGFTEALLALGEEIDHPQVQGGEGHGISNLHW